VLEIYELNELYLDSNYP